MPRHIDFGPVPKEVFLFLAEWLVRAWKETPDHPELCDRALNGKRGQVERWLKVLLRRTEWHRDERGYLDVTRMAGANTGNSVSTAMRHCLAVASRENGLRRCVQTAKDGDTFRLCWGGLIVDRRSAIRRVIWLYKPSGANTFTDSMKLGALTMAKELGLGIAFVECCLENSSVRKLLDRCLDSIGQAGGDDEGRRASTAVVWDREGLPGGDLQAALLELDGLRTVTVGPPDAMVRRDHVAVGSMLARQIVELDQSWPFGERTSRRVVLMEAGASYCSHEYAEILGGLRHALLAENQRLQAAKYELIELGFRERRNPKPFDLWQRFGLEADDCVVAVGLEVSKRFCRELQRYHRTLATEGSESTPRFPLLYASGITVNSTRALTTDTRGPEAICGVNPEAYGRFVVRVAARVDTRSPVPTVAPALLSRNEFGTKDVASCITSVFARSDIQLEDGEYCWEEWMVGEEGEAFAPKLPTAPCRCW